MELFDTLATFGLTTKVLQFIVIAAIAVVLIGMYWRIIAIGAGFIFCIMVFVGPTQSASINPADVVPAEFIEDCIKYGENETKASCEKLWKEEGNGKS